MSIIDELEKMSKKQAEINQLSVEEYERLRNIANSKFSDENGKLLLRAIKLFCKVEDFGIEDDKRVQYFRGRGSVFQMLLNLLNKEVRNNFERID